MRPLDTLRTIGRPIAYYPALAQHVGGVNAAIFLCQLMYWDEHAGDQALGVYKTADEWELETGLSYREQAGARRKLRDLGLLVETEQRLKHRIYYKLNHDSFNAFFERLANQGADGGDGGEDGESANDESASPQSTKAQAPNDENAIGGKPKAQSGGDAKRNPLIDTKTTTETTTEISSDLQKRAKYSGSFNRFWNAYPNTGRKVAKAKCEQVWKSKKLDLIADEIVSHVEAMKLSQQWVTGYEPAPLTYLNQKRWEDGVPMPGPAASLTPANQSSYAGMNKQEALEARNRAVAQRWAQGGV